MSYPGRSHRARRRPQSYGFANGDPVNFSDPFGLCPPCIGFVAGAIALAETAGTLYDIGDLIVTSVRALRGEATGRDVAITAGGVGLGIFVSGAGYGRIARTAANSLDDLSAAARAADRGGFTRAGRALTKHAAGQRAGSRLFPSLRGGVDEINATAQGIVDDILTNPGSTFGARSHPRFGDVVEVFDPSGRGLRFSDEGFLGFIQRN